MNSQPRVAIRIFRVLTLWVALSVAWSFIGWQLRRLLDTYIWYTGRAASASPAVGSLGLHKKEQAQLIQDAFTLG